MLFLLILYYKCKFTTISKLISHLRFFVCKTITPRRNNFPRHNNIPPRSFSPLSQSSPLLPPSVWCPKNQHQIMYLFIIHSHIKSSLAASVSVGARARSFHSCTSRGAHSASGQGTKKRNFRGKARETRDSVSGLVGGCHPCERPPSPLLNLNAEGPV